MFTKDDIKAIVALIIIVALIVVAVKFIIYLLPVIIVVFLALFLYDAYKNKKWFWQEDKDKKKDKKVREAQVISEKNND